MQRATLYCVDSTHKRDDRAMLKGFFFDEPKYGENFVMYLSETNADALTTSKVWMVDKAENSRHIIFCTSNSTYVLELIVDDFSNYEKSESSLAYSAGPT